MKEKRFITALLYLNIFQEKTAQSLQRASWSINIKTNYVIWEKRTWYLKPETKFLNKKFLVRVYYQKVGICSQSVLYINSWIIFFIENLDILWLNHNNEPWDEVLQRWKNCFDYRRQVLNDDQSHFVKFAESWPILKNSLGYTLVSTY